MEGQHGDAKDSLSKDDDQIGSIICHNLKSINLLGVSNHGKGLQKLICMRHLFPALSNVELIEEEGLQFIFRPVDVQSNLAGGDVKVTISPK